MGRDTASVFPNESKKAALQTDAAQAILQKGKQKFISETELAEIKSITGGKGRIEDGSIAADKPLAVILREQREAKDAQFKEQWKQMKTGKNRPLDEDEMEFLDGIAAAENARRQREADEEAAELDAFHKALKEQQETKARDDLEAEIGGEKERIPREASKKNLIKPTTTNTTATTTAAAAVVRIKPKIIAKVKPKRDLPVSDSKDNDVTQGEEQAKKQKVENTTTTSEAEGEGLAGLFGDYGSDDSD